MIQERSIWVLLSLFLFATNATAWEFDEHRFLGMTSYENACNELIKKYPYHDEGEDSAEKNRAGYLLAKVACLKVDGKYFYADLYGQSCGIAGDHLSSPEDFKSKIADRKASSMQNYSLLALQNSEHFYPHVMRHSQKYLNSSMLLALDAHNEQGIKVVELFEDAFFTHAFADHYLQDSFSAGHMGFNRPASGAAASMTLHTEWNSRGRLVMNGKGEKWRLTGDGKIGKDGTGWETEEEREAQERLLKVSNESVYSFLETFITGERRVESELEIWSSFPLMAEVPDNFSQAVEEVYGMGGLLIGSGDTDEEMKNLGLFNKPAQIKWTLDTWGFIVAPLDDKDLQANGVMVGGSVFVPDIVFQWPLRAYFGIGNVHPYENKTDYLGFDTGLIFPLPLFYRTQDGLFAHEISWGLTGAFKGALESSADKRAFLISSVSYRLNIEIGQWIFRPQIGLGLKDVKGATFNQLRYTYFGFGIGRVFSAFGGGIQ